MPENLLVNLNENKEVRTTLNDQWHSHNLGCAWSFMDYLMLFNIYHLNAELDVERCF